MGVMEQSRDSVKLFGKTIQVVPAGSNCSSSSNLEGEHQKNQKPINLENVRQENHQETNDSAQSGRSQQQSQGTANPSSLEMEKEGTSNNNNNNNSADEKAPKKPVSILPCPRCKSTDTKFCYFNNYNVNQPRYFCRNCQRYWTAGGSMRNVPVGAGRRKNKSSAATNTYPLSAQSAKDQILSFGSSDAKESSNGGSLVTNSSSEEDVVLRYQNQNQNQNLNQDQNPPIGSPWIYHLNPPPPSAYPISFFPAGAAIHWGYMAPPPPPPPQWVAAAPVNFAPQTSLSLGKKHSRVDVVVDEKRLFVPKTMRIDDPSDAANSSVWLTMGIENRKEDRKFGRGGLFKAFEPKGNQASSAEVLHRNPAAQSRSFLFQEST